MSSYRMAMRKIRDAASWHVSSVHVARRNALAASTALAQRRRELRETEHFLLEHRARWDARRLAPSRTA